MSEPATSRILHVDDREENRYIVSKILRGAGFQVIEGRTGQQALELASTQPDLIILDVRLPDMIGYEVSKRIKSNPATSSIPIIQLSASFISNESKVHALDSGADQYLTQPVEAPVLIASVKALMRMRRAEAISRLSAQQWQTTFDALSEGIGLLDNQQVVLRCNRAMSELLALPYGGIEGQDCKTILGNAFGVPAEKLQNFVSRQVFESQSGMRWYRVTIDPAMNNHNEPIGSILVIAETTAQKQAEEALKVTEKLAATGRLAHSIAHEINNPLEAVTNVIYLLKQSLRDHAESMNYLNIADMELQRVSRITKQTLSFHRDTSQPIKVSVSEILDSVLLLHRQQFLDKKLSLEKRFEETTLVDGYPGQLRQVFSNFVSNAVDASFEAGKVIIHVYDSRSWGRNPTAGVRIVICDTGKGIASADIAHIFDAFFTTKEQKGSGLGLWLSAGIINQHQGHIHVRSRVRPPFGTCFSLFLPSTAASKSNPSKSADHVPAVAHNAREKESA